MTAVPLDVRDAPSVRVVLFSGGRGSGALATTLIRTPGVVLTIAINGYDDGASTGEVRRFLGDALGPSDFRKNASRAAEAKGSASASLVQLLDARLPVHASDCEIHQLLERLVRGVRRDGKFFFTDAATTEKE